jgi:transcriptional regulator with XRE-family HTH domain
MAHKLNNYLKTYRKRAGLSQDEVAFLVGKSGGAKVSRYERARRLPSLETALAYRALFDLSLKELFPGVYNTVSRNMRKRARLLAGRPNTSARKQVALNVIAESAPPSRSYLHAQ